MGILYNILFSLGYVLLLPRFLLRMRRRGGYRRDFRERFGLYSYEKQVCLKETPRLWVHAVSVGEAMVALLFVQTWRQQDPSARFVLSVTTSTGHALMKKRKHPDDLLIYFPLDFPWVINRLLAQWQPTALVLTECEIWPNLLRGLHQRGIPAFVINGRVSDASFRGYRWLRSFFQRAAGCIDQFYVQTERDEQRLRFLGMAPEHVTVCGSAKYDVPRPEPDVAAAVRQAVADAGLDADGLLWVLGSTWPGEERLLMNVFRRLRASFPDLQVILVPRHMERRRDVASVLETSGFPYVMRSAMEEKAWQSTEKPVMLLADTTGELQGYYALATMVYIGKSLAGNHGGQNPIEPAALGKPVVTGANMENFTGVMEEMLSAEAVVQVADEHALFKECERLLSDETYRKELGSRAAELVETRRGVTERTVQSIRDRLG